MVTTTTTTKLNKQSKKDDEGNLTFEKAWFNTKDAKKTHFWMRTVVFLPALLFFR
jgi:hypothetical protein